MANTNFAVSPLEGQPETGRIVVMWELKVRDPGHLRQLITSDAGPRGKLPGHVWTSPPEGEAPQTEGGREA